MKPSEVVFLSTDKILGGGELFLIELLPELARRGWKITLVVPPSAPLAQNTVISQVSDIVSIDLSVKVKQWTVFFPSAIRFLSLVARRRRAVFYSNGFFGMKVLALSTALFRLKTVCHLHESEYSCYHNRRTRWQAPLINRFFAISTIVKEEFLTGAGVDPANVTVVHNGVPVGPPKAKSAAGLAEERQTLRLPSEGLLVGMAARTNSLKGHAVLLRAWMQLIASWQGPTLSLVVLGLERGEGEQSAVFDSIQSLLLHDHSASIHVREACPVETVRRVMAASDVWVVPSTSEGFGRTAIEAMAESTALIASDVGGLSDIVTHGVDGWHVPPGDARALTQALAALLMNAPLRESLAAAGHRTARSRFSLEGMTTLIHAQLTTLLLTDAEHGSSGMPAKHF